MKLSSPTPKREKANWSAIFSLFLGVTSLIAAEFIPVSLLTPIAQDLAVSEGLAGQSVTVVGIFAVIASLTLAPMTKKLDRRPVLLTLSALLVVSNGLVALAPGYASLLIGRSLLGICVGGFWSMASAVALQLAPPKDIPKALSVIYAGVSVATIISLPLASYLGSLIGWRSVFLLAALLGAIALIWQLCSLPSLPSQSDNGFKHMFGLFNQAWVLAGIGAIIFSYGGYHIFFTYLRPFLENILTPASNTLAGALLLFGVANCLGSFVAGAALGNYFRPTMLAIPVTFFLLAMLLFIGGENMAWGTVLAIGWGFIFGFVPVGWSTWITRTLADKAEAIGGLSVAAIQFSIGLAAAAGGLIFDNLGANGIFVGAALVMLSALTLTKLCFSLFSKATGRRV